MGRSATILILEDCPERVERFQRVLQKLRIAGTVKIWSDATRMIEEIEPWLSSADLISLDHDLEKPADSPHDPEDGLLIARYLGRRKPTCPVIIHSSNRERSTWMLGELELGGWECHRVPPIGEDWIEHDWRLTVKDILQTNP